MYDEDLVCAFCKKIYDSDPITLSPCGWVICSSHFVSQHIKCPVCFVQHTVSLSSTVKTKNIEIKYLKHKLEKSLQEFELTVNETSAVKNDREHYIHEFFGNIINRIDILREQVKMMVDSQYNTMLKQVQDAKKQCVSKMESNESLNKFSEIEYKETIKSIKEKLKENKMDQEALKYFKENYEKIFESNKSLKNSIGSLTENKKYELTPFWTIDSRSFGKLDITNDCGGQNKPVTSAFYGNAIISPLNSFTFGSSKISKYKSKTC